MERKYDWKPSDNQEFPFDVVENFVDDNGKVVETHSWGPVKTSKAAAILLDVLVEGRAATPDEITFMHDQFERVPSNEEKTAEDIKVERQVGLARRWFWLNHDPDMLQMNYYPAPIHSISGLECHAPHLRHKRRDSYPY
jgi:hypothetical protein